jgi:hypothetical protein|tara:strand:+ start:421 stop:852 length:432 start_codon:yes stop_codon:yes gene_type:complete
MSPHYPDSKNVASFGDLRRHYDAIKKELEQAESSLKAERYGIRQAVKGERETQAELKKSVGRTARLQKQVGAQERAKQDSNRAAAWSASAATAVTIFYQICRSTGQWPGGYKWADIWQHEATTASLVAGITWVLSQAYAATQD